MHCHEERIYQLVLSLFLVISLALSAETFAGVNLEKTLKLSSSKKSERAFSASLIYVSHSQGNAILIQEPSLESQNLSIEVLQINFHRNNIKFQICNFTGKNISDDNKIRKEDCFTFGRSAGYSYKELQAALELNHKDKKEGFLDLFLRVSDDTSEFLVKKIKIIHKELMVGKKIRVWKEILRESISFALRFLGREEQRIIATPLVREIIQEHFSDSLYKKKNLHFIEVNLEIYELLKSFSYLFTLVPDSLK